MTTQQKILSEIAKLEAKKTELLAKESNPQILAELKSIENQIEEKNDEMISWFSE